ncbi:MAG: helix-turn-helix domain-containing protein [Proteobacteria bacterium]|nr:helix-turn-helix domain-containing protein [Pseudomonadota bacterium]
MAQPVEKLKRLAGYTLTPGVTFAAVRVLALLIDFPTAPGGAAYPSIKTICTGTGLSERSVQNALSELMKAGILSIKVGGGRRQTNVYTINLETPQSIAGFAPDTPQNVVAKPRNILRKTPQSAAPKPSSYSTNDPTTRSCAVGWDDVLQVLKSNGFKIDDPIGKPEAHKLIDDLKRSESDPVTAYRALKQAARRPSDNNDVGDFFNSQRARAKSIVADIISDAVKAANERWRAKCPSNLVQSKIWKLRIYYAQTDERRAADDIIEAVKSGKLSQAAALAAVEEASQCFNGARLEALRKPLNALAAANINPIH